MKKSEMKKRVEILHQGDLDEMEQYLKEEADGEEKLLNYRIARNIIERHLGRVLMARSLDVITRKEFELMTKKIRDIFYKYAGKESWKNDV